MMLYELSFITGYPILSAPNPKNRRVYRETLSEVIDLADEICRTRDFDLLDHLSLLLAECDGLWETVYDTPITYVNMFIGRYKMHISFVHVDKEDVKIL